jgi:SAM-dependent methyltransferase
MAEINLMRNYPPTKRDLTERASEKTTEDILIAKRFGVDFFDGDRRYGYGGYHYHPRFFSQVVKDMIHHYNLNNQSSILDVGCAKGFMLYEFQQALPGAVIRGIDISSYAIENSKPEVRPHLSVGNARNLGQFNDKEFDLAVSITTLHNLPYEECVQAIKEIQRVGKNAFITLDAWRTDEEKKRMKEWCLTAETVMHADGWKELFSQIGYTGDFWWFIP